MVSFSNSLRKNKLVALLAGLAVSLFFSANLSAGTKYVSSLRAVVYNGPSHGSGKAGSLRRGTKVSVSTTQGSWAKVSGSGVSGWVKNVFLRNSPVGGKVSILGNKLNLNAQSRKRASASVSAASARGLDDESAMAGRLRASGQKPVFDPQALDKMESMVIGEEELLQFLKEGGLQK